MLDITFFQMYACTRERINEIESTSFSAINGISVIRLEMLMIFKRNATHCISPYAIIMCVCVCLCACVHAAFVDLRKTVWVRDVVFSKLLGMTPDITCKSFTQIGLHFPRRRTKWRLWNTIIGRNSATY